MVVLEALPAVAVVDQEVVAPVVIQEMAVLAVTVMVEMVQQDLEEQPAAVAEEAVLME
jgi:hypothetical protein